MRYNEISFRIFSGRVKDSGSDSRYECRARNLGFRKMEIHGRGSRHSYTGCLYVYRVSYMYIVQGVFSFMYLASRRYRVSKYVERRRGTVTN